MSKLVTMAKTPNEQRAESASLELELKALVDQTERRSVKNHTFNTESERKTLKCDFHHNAICADAQITFSHSVPGKVRVENYNYLARNVR